MREGMEPKKIQTKTIMVYIGSTREDLKWTIVYGVPSPLGIEMMWQFRKWQSTWYSSAFLIGFQTLTRDLLRKYLQFEWAFSHACIYIYIFHTIVLRQHEAWGEWTHFTESQICPERHCVTARLTAPQCFFAGLASSCLYEPMAAATWQTQAQELTTFGIWYPDIWTFWSPLAKEDNFSVGGGSGRACPQSTKWVRSSITRKYI